LAIAPWPAGDGPGTGPRFVVLFQEGPELFLCRMDLQGLLEPMGRTRCEYGWGRKPGARLAGPLAEVTFGGIRALAVDRDGEVILADGWGTIRRISRANQVVLVAGADPGPAEAAPDGRGPAPVFQEIVDMALDPQTGDLYVGEPTRVLRVRPGGEVATLLGAGGPGDPGAASREPCASPVNLVPDQPCPAPWPRDRPCLSCLRNLALQGRRLILFDYADDARFPHSYSALLAYDLPSGGLVKLVDGPRTDVPLAQYTRGARCGPLHLFSPYLDASRCAFLGARWQRMLAGDQEIFLRGPHFRLDQTLTRDRPGTERINLPQAALDRLFPPAPGPAAGRLRLRGEAGVLHGGTSRILRAEWDGAAPSRPLDWSLPAGFAMEDLGGGAIRLTAPAVTEPRRIVIRVGEASSSSATQPERAELALEVAP
jgi:hypothetical protein